MNRYHQLATYLRHRFGCRVQKIPLDAGFTCPNRDGSISAAGCVFCNPAGSGSGMGLNGLSLQKQWAFWHDTYNRKRNAGLFIAYLQSFSNTYGPIKKLERTLDAIRELPDLAGLSIGTRPDCVDQEKLNLIAGQPMDEIWIEFGLQSAHAKTLATINRGHNFATFETATYMAAELGLRVCVHVIAGLPGETVDDFYKTVEAVNVLPIRGIKFHSLYVAEHTKLAEWWRNGDFLPMDEDSYREALLYVLPRLRPDIIVQRLTGDAAEGELLAPVWPSSKREFLDSITKRLEATDLWQGKLAGAEKLPLWYSLRQNLPKKMQYAWSQQYSRIAKEMQYLEE